MKRWLSIGAAILVVFFLLIWFGYRSYLSLSVADYNGDVPVSGLNAEVQVSFDAKGIPQIWAIDDHDLYMTLGFLHASERLFQMEIVRRLSQGKLSEILGSVTLDYDKRQRTIGFHRKAIADEADLTETSRFLINAYINGVNQWIETHSPLPPEFELMGFLPEPWQISDVLTIAIYQTWFSHELMDKDKNYQKLVDKLGTDILPLLNDFQRWSPSTIDPEHSPYFQENFPARMSKASNSWVVSPIKSQSGAALHASDPHLMIDRIPGFWYLAGLHSETGTQFVGTTVAGLPGGLMGHTDSIAFAFTVASIDIIDYYNEDSQQNLNVINEQILVKDQDPVDLKIEIASQGPVIEHTDSSLVSMRWAGFDFSAARIVESFFKLLSVRNFKEFQSTVTQLGATDINWTYSDRNGNIAYQLAAPIPKRNYVNTFLKQDATDENSKWQGYTELEKTPFEVNPERGWIATCNNQIVNPNWPEKIPGFYDNYRIVRATELLSIDTLFNQSDMETMQMDIQSVDAKRWKDLFFLSAYLLADSTLIREITNWDFRLNNESRIASTFTYWSHYMSKFIFEDDLADDWPLTTSITDQVMENEIGKWIDRNDTKGKESLEILAAKCLEFVIKEIPNRPYGEISILEIEHPLSSVPLLDSWLNLNRGPVSKEGSFATLNSNYNSFDDGSKQFKSHVGASMRFVLDWADIDGFSLMTNLGQSGNPFSPHYDDFLDDWISGKRWVVPFSKQKVFQKSKSILHLQPAK
ncbi:MAG: penicillin acylase family protein [Calditrichaeota bacterium]|nr:penicillin acylase family protein [Calditrichota bacterium]